MTSFRVNGSINERAHNYVGWLNRPLAVSWLSRPMRYVRAEAFIFTISVINPIMFFSLTGQKPIDLLLIY